MKIGGLLKFSLIDFPDKISAVIFTQGCNFRCPYCHNPELVLPEKFQAPIDHKDIFSFLDSRRGQIEGVVITGGEPTLQKDLASFMYCIKDLGYLVKLDTNGSSPDVLKKVINQKLADYIAMDIKAPLDKYDLVSGVDVDIGDIMESMELIYSSGIKYEFRTTIDERLLNPDDIVRMNFMTVEKTHRFQKCEFQESMLDESYSSLKDRKPCVDSCSDNLEKAAR